jgi:hypothetical protein
LLPETVVKKTVEGEETNLETGKLKSNLPIFAFFIQGYGEGIIVYYLLDDLNLIKPTQWSILEYSLETGIYF